ncbi:hypothetical protein [Halovulum sp. GXIMD14793]
MTYGQAKAISPAMIVSCLHTLDANIAIFEAACPPEITLMHHVHSELMNRALERDHLGLLEETQMHLRRLAPISDAVVLTSSLLRDAAGPPFYHSDRVLRDAVCRAAPGQKVEVMVASPRVLPRTEALFSDLKDHNGLTFTLIGEAWGSFAAGDTEAFAETIKSRVAASDAEIVVLAQTVMSLGAGDDPRVMTGPGVTFRTILEDHPG